MSFPSRLRAIQNENNSLLCVGLDPDPDRLPPDLLSQNALPDAIRQFNRGIIEATAHLACAFKLNFAFYEALGPQGFHVLQDALAAIPQNVLSIADAKRGDIGNSARFYAKSLFSDLHFDACTVSPYMGRESIQPFLDFPDTATFVLTRTSNPSADEIQNFTGGGLPLYRHVARKVALWNEDAAGTAGLVAGATDPDALRQIRQDAPHLPFLIPGVGAQGGSPSAVIDAAGGEHPVLVNSSRSILYAYESTGDNYKDAARTAADSLRQKLNA